MTKTPYHWPMMLFQGDALEKMAWLARPDGANNRYDLVLTSPPAYPPGLHRSRLEHVAYLGRLVRRARTIQPKDAYLVLVIQDHPDHHVMEPLGPVLGASGYRLLRTVRWQHGNTHPSWIIFMGKGNARLHGGTSDEWLIPHPEPDSEYGWYEFPQELVDEIVKLTIPDGGTILDPFIGKGEALRRLPPKYTITGIDLEYSGTLNHPAPTSQP